MKEQKQKIFPNDFQWGVATSASQLEGSPYADWTSWDPFREDLKLLKELGGNQGRRGNNR
jgi:beta-glucosidase